VGPQNFVVRMPCPYAGEKCIRCLLKIVYASDREVGGSYANVKPSPTRTPSRTPSKAQAIALIKTLKEVLYTFISDTITVIDKEVKDQSCYLQMWEGKTAQ